VLHFQAITALPKISLHDHLDGGVRPRTIIELSRDAKESLPTYDPGELSEIILTNSRSGSLTDYLSSFALVTRALQTAPALERVAHELVEDLAADGVIYAEVRWAPHVHTGKELSLDRAVQAVQRGLVSGMAAIGKTGHEIRVEQLLTALRHEQNAQAVAELAIRHRAAGVVGFDIAGPEAGYALDQHRPALETLATRCMPTTIHAGEADGVESIRSAIVDGRALRIGHGVRIANDITVNHRDGNAIEAHMGEVATWILDRQIALEISPTSNVQTGAIAEWGDTIAAHPFDLLYRLGFAVTVNVDNRTMSATTLTHELDTLASTFGYGMSDLIRFQTNAAEATFLPRADRIALKTRIEAHEAMSTYGGTL
jgi:adenosine deaminase